MIEELALIGPLVLAMTIFFAGLWGVFEKAGYKGWAAFIPLYNLVVLHQAAGKPVWWVVVQVVCSACPLVNFILFLFVYQELAKRFGKGGGFAFGLLMFPIVFLPLLGLGKATYTLPEGPG